jgi:indolepyruvate ferredoxin oxidoreductase beta subunit
MDLSYKILVAGVGGQGVVYLTNLLVKSALLANLPVATSEIHGLAQRGGSVTAGVTLGDNSFGFLEKGGVDLLLGLEPLEAQRCVSYLHHKSIAIIDNNRILPYSVNSGNSTYPDIEKFIHYLKENISNVIYIKNKPDNVDSIYMNIYVLGKACSERQFPIQAEFVESAIRELVKNDNEEKSLEVFRLGLNSKQEIIEPS